MDGLRSFFGAKTQHAKPAANKKPATTPEAKTQTQAVKIPRPQEPTPAPVKATTAPVKATTAPTTPAIHARPQTNRPAPAPQAARNQAKPTPPPKPVATREMTAQEYATIKAEVIELHQLLNERDAARAEIAKANNTILEIRKTVISDLQAAMNEMEAIPQQMDHSCDYHKWYIINASSLHSSVLNDLNRLKLKGESTTALPNEYDKIAELLNNCDNLTDAADLELKLKNAIETASNNLQAACKEANDIYDKIIEKEELSDLFQCASEAINNLSDIRASLPAWQAKFHEPSTKQLIDNSIQEHLSSLNKAFSNINIITSR